MKELDQIKSLKLSPVFEPHLDGLISIEKRFASDGSSAFLTVSDLDLDTDGAKDPGIKYEPTHQSQTSIDPAGTWLNSNKLNFTVLPLDFAKRHGGSANFPKGCLCTVVYKGKFAHAIYADDGPHHKFGEGSIALHRALGFERVKPNKRIQDVGIDQPVFILWYIGSNIGKTPCIQADINKACEPLWAKFTS